MTILTETLACLGILVIMGLCAYGLPLVFGQEEDYRGGRMEMRDE